MRGQDVSDVLEAVVGAVLSIQKLCGLWFECAAEGLGAEGGQEVDPVLPEVVRSDLRPAIGCDGCGAIRIGEQ